MLPSSDEFKYSLVNPLPSILKLKSEKPRKGNPVILDKFRFFPIKIPSYLELSISPKSEIFKSDVTLPLSVNNLKEDWIKLFEYFKYPESSNIPKSDIDDGNISPKIPGYVFLKSVDDDSNLFISMEIPFISLVSKSNFTNPSKEDDELIISRSLREMLF